MICTKFVYKESIDKSNIKLLSCSILDTRLSKDLYIDKIRSFPLSSDDEINIFREYIKNNKEHIFFGFDIQMEIACLCQILDKNEIISMKWIDIWVEAKQIILSHIDYYCPDPDFLDCLKAFKIFDKIDIDLIKYNQLIEREDTNEIINGYCYQIIGAILSLKNKVFAFYKDFNKINHEFNKIFSIDHSIRRGEYCVINGIIYGTNKGFPIDINLFKLINENKNEIKNKIAEESNKKTGFEIFYNRRKNSPLSISTGNLENYCLNKNITLEKTKNGHLKISEEVLSLYKSELYDFVNAKNILKQFDSFPGFCSKNGYIKTKTYPFHQKTSRSSPKPSKGHLLSQAPWIKMNIRCHDDKVLIHSDFKEQEILIAASLSNDTKMLKIYGNSYLQTAIDLGFAPQEATKETHKQIRDLFKKILCSIIYGISEYSLVPIFMKHLGLSAEAALEQATFLILKHKENYKDYWNYVYKTNNISKARGYYQCPFSKWVYFIGKSTRSTQIQNAPIQLAASEMKRIAKINAVKSGLNVIADLHDAIFIESDAVHNFKKDSELLSYIMCQASKEILNNNKMIVETNFITSGQHFYDEKGVETFNSICDTVQYKYPDFSFIPSSIFSL